VKNGGRGFSWRLDEGNFVDPIQRGTKVFYFFDSGLHRKIGSIGFAD